MDEKDILNRFFDISGHFLSGLANDRERSTSLVRHLAFAIGRTLYTNVFVLWRPNPDGSGDESAYWGLDEQPLPPATIEDQISRLEKSLAPNDAKRYGNLFIHRIQSDHASFLFMAAGVDGNPAARPAELPHQLWIFSELAGDSSFLSHIPTWSVLYRMFLLYMEERTLTLSLHRAAEIERHATEAEEPEAMLRRAIPLLGGTLQRAPESPQDPYRADRQLLTALIQKLFDSPQDLI
ncbi:MAG TPA: hypothetical protein VGM86_33410, partial [Thermoanaerobaculia bacterium]